MLEGVASGNAWKPGYIGCSKEIQLNCLVWSYFNGGDTNQRKQSPDCATRSGGGMSIERSIHSHRIRSAGAGRWFVLFFSPGRKFDESATESTQCRSQSMNFSQLEITLPDNIGPAQLGVRLTGSRRPCSGKIRFHPDDAAETPRSTRGRHRLQQGRPRH
jgi:hypothetical protein